MIMQVSLGKANRLDGNGTSPADEFSELIDPNSGANDSFTLESHGLKNITIQLRTDTLEIGADAVLVNTAIAQAEDPRLMGEAFKKGVEAGRKAYLAGRIPTRNYANASSPTSDVPQPR